MTIVLVLICFSCVTT